MGALVDLASAGPMLIRSKALTNAEIMIAEDLADGFHKYNFITNRGLEWARKRLSGIAYMPIVRTAEPYNVVRFANGWRSEDPALTVERINDKQLLARYSFKTDIHIHSALRRFAGAKVDSKRGGMIVRLNYFAVKDLIKLGFTLDAVTAAWAESLEAHPVPADTSTFLGTLRPFQSHGVNFIVAKGGRVLLADEQGLGKTIQIIGAGCAAPELLPALVICPASAKGVWPKELVKFSDMSYEVLSGRTPIQGWKPTRDFTIINYDICHWWQDVLRGKFNWVICDEAQFLINHATKRAFAVETITNSRKRTRILITPVACLSGTPVEKETTDLYFMTKLVEPELMGTKQEMEDRFVTVDAKGKKMSTPEQQKELHALLKKTVLLRRKKEDVAKELPKKQRVVVPIELTNMKEYKKAEDDFLRWLIRINPSRIEAAQRAEALVRFQYLKLLSFKGKQKGIVDWIKTYMTSGNKLVVFSWHKEAISYFKSSFPKGHVVIDGSVTGVKRTEVEKQFQTNPATRLLFGQLKAAGTALTLTAAPASLTVEFWWTHGVHSQAEDRVHRIGQKHDAIFAYYAAGMGTIDEEICELLDTRKALADGIIDGEAPEKSSMLTDLIKSLKRR